MTTTIDTRLDGGLDLVGPLVALHGSGILTATEFRIQDVIQVSGREDTEEQEIAQWEAIGRFFGTLSRASKFWIADWLNFGDRTWGERVAQAIEATGLDERTLANYASVGRKVLPERRRAELSWTAHVVVASLEPDKQEEWLQKAIDNGWRSRELEAAIRAVSVPQVAAAQPQWEEPEQTEAPVDARQVVQAARHVWRQAQRDGDAYRVPVDAFARLASALGHE